MQTHRRFSFWPIQAEGTNTRTYTCAHGPNNVSSIEKRRETLYLPTSFDPSPSLSLFSLILSHILPLPGSSMNVSLFQIPAAGLHTPICLQMLLFTVQLTVSVCVCVCVVLCAECVCVPVCMHMCNHVWVSETTEYRIVENVAHVGQQLQTLLDNFPESQMSLCSKNQT